MSKEQENQPEKFPRGKISGDDEGELSIQMGVTSDKSTLIMEFGKPIHWFGMGRKEVRGLVEQLLRLEKLLEDPE